MRTRPTITLEALDPFFQRWDIRMMADDPNYPACDPDNPDPENPNCADMLKKKAQGKTWFTMAASAADPAVSDIAIYDQIGFWGITSQDFRDGLAALGDPKTINLRINSPGGEVFDGIAIYNMLARHPATVNVTVDGLAASIASLIAMCGDTVEMPENAMMMIHNPAGMAMGDASVMRELADALDKIRDSVVTSYVSKTGKTPDEIIALMDATTWMTAKEAVDMGFADKVTSRRSFTNLFDLSMYKDPPKMVSPDWKVGAARDLAIDPSYTWDGPAAAERMLDKAGFNGDNPDTAAAQRGFLVHDAAAPRLKGSYKLPFADIIGGELKASAGGLRAAASRLPQTDIPDNVRTEARGVIDHYQAKEDHPANARAKKSKAEAEKPGAAILAAAQELEARAAVLPPYDPDDAAEAQALFQSARALLDDAAAALDGTEPDEAADQAQLLLTQIVTDTQNKAKRKPVEEEAPPVDHAKAERDRCAEIVAACELAGHPGKAAGFINSDKTPSQVKSELRGMPRGTRTDRGADDVSARHTGLTETEASWGPVIDRVNQRVTGGKAP
jgi:ATP-dependent Clp endopeptidase proteolytic subunit ClpP